MNKLLFDISGPYRTIRHLIFFIFTVLVFNTILTLQHPENSFYANLWITFLNALFFFGYAYITIFLLVPEYLIKRKVAWFITLFILIGVALSALKLVVSDQIYYASLAPENVDQKGLFELRYIVVNTKDMSFIVALFCIAKYVKDYVYVQGIKKQLEDENKQAQVKLIQSQFDPHFLFNTINNLYALSLLNPQKTFEVIGGIIKVLGFINTEIRKTSVLLNEEIELVENYVRLEKIRYGERLNVQLLVKDHDDHFPVPPMVLFYLVENCFRHGSSLDAGTPWIKITVEGDEEKVCLNTENSIPTKLPGQDEVEETQVDLINLRKRLNIMYQPDGFDLEVTRYEAEFAVKLCINRNFENQSFTYR